MSDSHELYRIEITVSLDDNGELVSCDFSEGLTRLYALGMLGWATDTCNRVLADEAVED